MREKRRERESGYGWFHFFHLSPYLSMHPLPDLSINPCQIWCSFHLPPFRLYLVAIVHTAKIQTYTRTDKIHHLQLLNKLVIIFTHTALPRFSYRKTRQQNVRFYLKGNVCGQMCVVCSRWLQFVSSQIAIKYFNKKVKVSAHIFNLLL